MKGSVFRSAAEPRPWTVKAREGYQTERHGSGQVASTSVSAQVQ